MSERKLRWYYRDKLARLGYDVEGLDLHQLKELNAEHKRKTRRLKGAHIENEIDKGVENFYKAVKEERMTKPNPSIPSGISPLIKGYQMGEIVDLDGKPLKPEKKEKKKIWNF